jgi:hypothetical protein
MGITIHYISKLWTLKKLTVHCGEAEGRHTTKNIAEHLDKAITQIPGLPTQVHTVCTSDNAANMLCAIPKLTEEIDEGLGCIDHLLNLVVNDCLETPEISDAVEAFRNLSSRTHRANLDQQRIKRECERMSKDDSVNEDGKSTFNCMLLK